jgi:hypothetical protein
MRRLRDALCGRLFPTTSKVTAPVAKIMSDPSLYEMLSFDQLATRVAHALVS